MNEQYIERVGSDSEYHLNNMIYSIKYIYIRLIKHDIIEQTRWPWLIDISR